ncbi:hypothetical protein HOY80DRAFT_1090752 [Tuber brumale]|nr:hypothetical protein HOY80DRAFT_1090752 [Tuber brumale]
MTRARRAEDPSIPGAVGNTVNWGATGWRGFDDVTKSGKRKTSGELQRGQEKAVSASNLINVSKKKEVTVVIFVGGCTFRDIAPNYHRRQHDACCYGETMKLFYGDSGDLQEIGSLDRATRPIGALVEGLSGENQVLGRLRAQRRSVWGRLQECRLSMTEILNRVFEDQNAPSFFT